MEDKEQNQYVDRVSAARGQSVQCVGSQCSAWAVSAVRDRGRVAGRIDALPAEGRFGLWKNMKSVSER